MILKQSSMAFNWGSTQLCLKRQCCRKVSGHLEFGQIYFHLFLLFSFYVPSQDLTFLSHMDQLVLMKEVNLSHNHLSSLDECNMLQCVITLDVSNNELQHITKRHALRLNRLQELSLSNNSILFKRRKSVVFTPARIMISLITIEAFIA